MIGTSSALMFSMAHCEPRIADSRASVTEDVRQSRLLQCDQEHVATVVTAWLKVRIDGASEGLLPIGCEDGPSAVGGDDRDRHIPKVQGSGGVAVIRHIGPMMGKAPHGRSPTLRVGLDGHDLIIP